MKDFDHMTTYRRLLEQTPAPFALYGFGLTPENPNRVDWIMKVTTPILQHLGQPPQLCLKAGEFILQDCLLIVLLFQPGDDRRHPLIAAWMNAFNHEMEGLTAIRHLSTQSHLHFHIFDEHNIPRRHIVLDNCTKHFFSEAARHIERMPPWTMSMFDRAKAYMETEYPRLEDLWAKL